MTRARLLLNTLGFFHEEDDNSTQQVRPPGVTPTVTSANQNANTNPKTKVTPTSSNQLQKNYNPDGSMKPTGDAINDRFKGRLSGRQ